MNSTWIEGPHHKITSLAQSAQKSGVHVFWLFSESDIEKMQAVHSFANDPFFNGKIAVFVGRDVIGNRSVSSDLESLCKANKNVTVVVCNCPKSVSPALKEAADARGLNRNWSQKLDLGHVQQQLSEFFGKNIEEEFAQKIFWCVSTSSWSDSIDADVLHMECEKLRVLFPHSVPTNDEITLACFRQKNEAMKYIVQFLESGDTDSLIREVSRAERLLQNNFFGLASSALFQICKLSKLNSMRSSLGWSKNAAYSFTKTDKEGSVTPVFHPRQIERADREDPKPYIMSIALSMFSSICAAQRYSGVFQEQMWITRFYAVLLLGTGAITPKQADAIFKGTEIS